MDRLTKQPTYSYHRNKAERGSVIAEMYDRLAAYEDTGLSPDEITAALSRLAEYDAAEREGLLVRLPCRVGDTLYENYEGETDYGKVQKINIEIEADIGAYSLEDIGKDVFVSYAEAEKGEGE